MICQFAIDDIEELESAGLHPSPSDIVRLNALGLKLQAKKNKHAATTLDYLPRVAVLTDTLSFRQPTVGHEIWLDRISQTCDMTDFRTVTAVRAFALSRPASDLPDPLCRESVKTAVETFAAQFAALTHDQIVAALDYVIFGASSLIGECAPSSSRRDDDRLPDGTESEDWKECYSLGLLNEGKIVLFGMNQREMESLTRRQLEDAIRRAYIFHHMDYDDGVNAAVASYYLALDEIKARLMREKDEHGE